MPILDETDINEISGKFISAGQTKKAVILERNKFKTAKGRTMVKFLVKDAETGDVGEICDFGFTNEMVRLNDQIEFDHTILKIECIDNGSQWPDYSVEVVEGSVKEVEPFK